MFKESKKIEYKLFGLIIFYTISTSLFVISPFMTGPSKTGFGLIGINNNFNPILIFLCLFLTINLTISFFVFLTEIRENKMKIIIGIFTFLIAIIFVSLQWVLIAKIANNETDDGASLILRNLFFTLILNFILCLFYNEFLKLIIYLGNKNKPAKCFIVWNWEMFLSKNKYILINNNVLLTYNKWRQIDIIMFDQLEEEILDFGGEERKILNKKLDPNTKDIMSDFEEEKTTIIYTKPNKSAFDLNNYIINISTRVESPILCILINSGIYVPILKGNIPNYIKIIKKVQIKKKIQDNLMEGTKLSFNEIGEKI